MINVGIVGYGYWGPNLVRNFSNVQGCHVKMVADGRQERCDIVKKNYPDVQTVLDAKELIDNLEIDAVVIATPVFSHFELAKRALLK